MKKITKIGNVILYMYASFLFITAITVVIRFDNTWVGMALAVLVCPGTYYLLHKKFSANHRIMVWVFRGVTLGTGLIAILLTFFANPFYRCLDFSIVNQAEEYFDANNGTGQLEYRSVSSIKKPEHGDYRIVTAMVECEDRHTKQTMKQELCWYFDRLIGRFFNSFEEMRQYRREHAEDYLLQPIHFEEEQLNARITETADYVRENDYAGVQQLFEEECAREVTEPRWAGWNQELSSLGGYRKIENVAFSGQLEENAERFQTVGVEVTLRYVSGKATVRMTINENLKLEMLSVEAEME